MPISRLPGCRKEREGRGPRVEVCGPVQSSVCYHEVGGEEDTLPCWQPTGGGEEGEEDVGVCGGGRGCECCVILNNLSPHHSE